MKTILRATLGVCLCALPSIADELTLQSACSYAIENGWQMRINKVDNTARTWEKRNVVASYLPQVSYSGTLLRMEQKTVDKANMFFAPDTSRPWFDPEPLKTRRNTITHEISISQPITNGGAEILAIRMANHTQDAIENGYAADRQDLILSVTRSYFDLIKVREQKKILESTVTWAEKNAENAQIRFDGGAIPKTELLRWKQQVADSKGAFVQIEAAEAVSVAALAGALGLPPDTSVSWTLNDFSVFESEFSLLDTVESGSVENSKRLAMLDSYRKVANDGRSLSVSAFLPKINAFASFKRDQGWDDGSDMILKEGAWAGGVVVAVPLFSGLKNSTNYMKAKYDAYKSTLTYEQTRAGLETNLIRIREFSRSSRTSALLAKQSLDLAQESFDALSTRYNAGQVSQVDLLDMNRALVGARIDYVTKVLDAIAYNTEYRNATGSLEVSK